MIPANHKYFLLSDLASSRDYELCVLAVYDDGITALTGTKLVGCVSFTTETEYGRCHSIRDQVGAAFARTSVTKTKVQTVLNHCPHTFGLFPPVPGRHHDHHHRGDHRGLSARLHLHPPDEVQAAQ